MTHFKKWKKIRKFSDIFYKLNEQCVSDMYFNAKIKLHGTNAGIIIKDDKVFAQSRNRIEDDGHFDFVQFVKDNFENNLKRDSTNLIIYGEWAGPEIQKTVAVTRMDKKRFFVFSIYDPFLDIYILDPTFIDNILQNVFKEINDDIIKILPWFFEDNIPVNMTNPDDAREFFDHMECIINDIGNEDPYIKNEFDISGPGEGLVFYGYDQHSKIKPIETMFKIKTEKHMVNKPKKEKVLIVKPEGIDDFIDTFFTENRFNQMVNDHLDDKFDMKLVGPFIKYVMCDVLEESVNEMEVADFEWKMVSKFATPTVRNWYIKKCNTI